MKFIVSGSSQNISSCSEHSHIYNEIIILSNGICETIVDQISYQMQQNSVLIIPSGHSHSNYSSTNYSDIFIQVDDFPSQITSPLLIHDYSGNIMRIMQTINSLNVQQSYKHIDNLIFILISLIEDAIGVNYKYRCSLLLKNLIEMNFSDPAFSLPATAETRGYNYDYIRRCYKTDMRTTPTAYLIELRSRHAEKLLKYTSYSIATISFQCGFFDQYYFSKIFKQKTGESPSQYRNHHNKQSSLLQ